MKKIYLLFSLCFFVQSMNAQSAGLPWSNDCFTNRRESGNTAIFRDLNITQASIDSALNSVDTVPNKVKILFFPRKEYYILEPITIGSNVVLVGSQISPKATFRIVNNPFAGITIKGATNSGIEGITFINETSIDQCFGGSENTMFSIKIVSSSNCWVKGVTSLYGGPSGHIQIVNGNNNEVSGCKVTLNRDASDLSGGRAYGINIQGSDRNLILGNIISYVRHHILLFNNSKFNVITNNKLSNTDAYNYGTDWACFFNKVFLYDTPIYGPISVDAIDLFIPGQIEFHGGDPNGTGPSQNIVSNNCLDGHINYYFEASKGKANNSGGDSLISNFSPTRSRTVHFADPPITPPIDLSSQSPNQACFNETVFITCRSILTRPIVTVNIIPCRMFYNQYSGRYLSTTPGTINGEIEGGTPPFTIDITNLEGARAIKLSNVNQQSFQVEVLGGNFDVKVTDATGKVTTSPALVNCTKNYISGPGRYEEIKITNTNTTINTTSAKDKIQGQEGTSENPEIITTAQLKAVDKTPLGLVTYPNPTTDQMTIRYKLGEADIVTIQLMNSIGQVVRVIENQVPKNSGVYAVSFNRENLGNGVYHGVLMSKNYKYNFKIVLN